MRRVNVTLVRLAAFSGGVAFAGLLLVAAEASAFRMVPMNLREMAVKAERIVVVVCTAREEGEMPVSPDGPPVGLTQYTFQVTERLKGTVGQTLTIRQVRLGRKPPSQGIEQPLGSSPLPLPDYQPGQEVLLFLGGDSSLGLTSPVAMDGAVFDVETIGGQKAFKHRFGNLALFRDLSVPQLAETLHLSPEEIALFSVKAHELIPYAPFVSLVRKLMNGN